jgi:hypothetical protein
MPRDGVCLVKRRDTSVTSAAAAPVARRSSQPPPPTAAASHPLSPFALLIGVSRMDMKISPTSAEQIPIVLRQGFVSWFDMLDDTKSLLRNFYLLCNL